MSSRSEQAIVRAQESTDPRELTALASARAWRVVVEVAKNPACPGEVVESLAEHWSYGVRAAVAATMPVLGVWEARFARDAEAWVRRSLTKNPALSPATVDVLLADSNPGVRKSLAWRTDLTDDALRALVADRDADVRSALVKNRSTPDWVVTALAADGAFTVRQAVAYSGRLTDDGIADLVAADPAAMVALSRRKDHPYSDAILKLFCTSQDHWVRCNVVDRPDCPPDVLDVLARDTDREVRGRVAAHANTREVTLVELALGQADSVLSQVLNRRGGVDLLVKNSDPAVRRKVLRLIPAHDPRVAALATDPDPKVRAEFADREATEEVLAQMVGDPEKRVRATVGRRTRAQDTLDSSGRRHRLGGAPERCREPCVPFEPVGEDVGGHAPAGTQGCRRHVPGRLHPLIKLTVRIRHVRLYS